MNDQPTERPFRVEAIDHVEFFVPNRHEAAAWYRDLLGFEELPDPAQWAQDPRGPLMITSDGGRTKLALFRGPGQGEQPTAGFHRVAFRVDGAGMVAFLKRAAARSLKDLSGQPIGRNSVSDHEASLSVYFQDPWGHRLEVTTYEVETAQRLLD